MHTLFNKNNMRSVAMSATLAALLALVIAATMLPRQATAAGGLGKEEASSKQEQTAENDQSLDDPPVANSGTTFESTYGNVVNNLVQAHVPSYQELVSNKRLPFPGSVDFFKNLYEFVPNEKNIVPMKAPTWDENIARIRSNNLIEQVKAEPRLATEVPPLNIDRQKKIT